MRSRLILGLMLLGFAVPPARAAQPQEPGTAALKPDEKRELNKLMADFRAARRDLGKQAGLVDQAVARGQAFVAAMYAAIGREMQPQLQHYSSDFYQQAAKLTGQRVNQINPVEVATLRQKVLGLRNRPDFCESLIIKEADPAMKRLEQIFLIDRADVLKSSEALQAERKRLGEMGALWEKCAVELYKGLPDNEGKPKEPPSFEKYLAGEESLAAGLAGPLPPKTREILAANARLGARIEPEEARAVLALNLMRNLLGLTPVLIDLRLCAAARGHSQDMQTLKFLSHESPVPGKKTFSDRAKLCGTTASTENIAVGYTDGQAAIMGWFHSPGHQENMLADYARIGMGQAGPYFTQMFGK